jgi:hypothetical protein
MKLAPVPAALMVLVLGLFVVGNVLGYVTDDPQTAGNWGGGGWVGLLTVSLALATFAVVGALVASRQPGNAVGWLLIAVGMSWALDSALEGYAMYGLSLHPGSLPLAEYADALDDWLWRCSIGIMGTFLFQLFPDGRPLTPRWRVLTWASAAALLLAVGAAALAPGTLRDSAVPEPNPLGVSGLGWLSDLAAVALTALLICIPLSAVSLLLRYRRSQGITRLQLKWLVSAVTAIVLFYAAVITISGGDNAPWWLVVLQDLTVISFCLIPLSIGAAILRYRLFDIDMIVRRTVIYAVLIASLALMYAAAITALGWIGRTVTGQSGTTAVTLSTLLVAVSFQPLRSRIQVAVDRRFYRRRYDASAAAAMFAGQLRSQIDLDALDAELIAAINRTVQPSHVTLWLRR